MYSIASMAYHSQHNVFLKIVVLIRLVTNCKFNVWVKVVQLVIFFLLFVFRKDNISDQRGLCLEEITWQG